MLRRRLEGLCLSTGATAYNNGRRTGARLVLHSFFSSNNNNNNNNNNEEEIANYLQETLGIATPFHKDILEIVESIQGTNARLQDLQAFSNEDMQALAASVEQEQRRKFQKGQTKGQAPSSRPSRLVKFWIPHEKKEFELTWKQGDSLLKLAQDNDDLLGDYIEGACGGTLGCCTCHVYLEQPEVFSSLQPPGEAELDMLDLAFEPREESSRLGCQVRLTPAQINISTTPLEVTIPCGVNNVWNED
jgi:2Fe-2S ferredoxin